MLLFVSASKVHVSQLYIIIGTAWDLNSLNLVTKLMLLLSQILFSLAVAAITTVKICRMSAAKLPSLDRVGPIYLKLCTFIKLYTVHMDLRKITVLYNNCQSGSLSNRRVASKIFLLLMMAFSPPPTTFGILGKDLFSAGVVCGGRITTAWVCVMSGVVECQTRAHACNGLRRLSEFSCVHAMFQILSYKGRDK